MPHSPKPPIMIVAPSGMSATASVGARQHFVHRTVFYRAAKRGFKIGTGAASRPPIEGRTHLINGFYALGRQMSASAATTCDKHSKGGDTSVVVQAFGPAV